MRNILFCYRLAGIIAASAFAAQSAVAQGQAQPVHYTVTDLGPANGSTPGQPFVIKNNGLMGGGANYLGTAWHATLSLLGFQIDLAKAGGLGGPNSAAFDVNQRAQAVGEAETKNPDPKLEDFCGFGTQLGCQGFFWQNGTMMALAPLKDASGAAGRNSSAKAINILGQAAGTAENTTVDTTCPAYNPSATSLQFQMYQFKPVIWQNGSIQALATSGQDIKGKAFNDPDGVVFKISDSGEAVGATGTCTGFTSFLTYLNGAHATLWSNGSIVDLGNLGGVAPGFGNFAYDINKFGRVVGTSGTSDGSFHAFFWSAETLIQDLGMIAGDVASVGLAISDAGDVGGVSFPADPNAAPRAFIRPDGGTMVDLNSLIPADSELYLFSVCSINSHGDIIGLAFDERGGFHGFLATPTDGTENPLDATAYATRSARFAPAWKAARQREGSVLSVRR